MEHPASRHTNITVERQGQQEWPASEDAAPPQLLSPVPSPVSSPDLIAPSDALQVINLGTLSCNGILQNEF